MHKAFRSSNHFSSQTSALSLLGCLIIKSSTFFLVEIIVDPLFLFIKSSLNITTSPQSFGKLS